MFKKLIPIIFLGVSTYAHAETCPSVVDIKNHALQGWEVYSSDNGSPLTSKQFDKFKQLVQQFSLAEYAEDAPEGAGHCYYADSTHPYMFAFLAKMNVEPDNTNHQWHNQGDFLRCQSTIADCLFKAQA